MTFLRDASIALWMKAHRINRTDQHQKFSLSVGRELWLKMYFKKSLFLILRDAYVLWKFPLRSSPHVWARRALEKGTEILGLVEKMSERKASTLRQSQNVYFSELVYIFFFFFFNFNWFTIPSYSDLVKEATSFFRFRQVPFWNDFVWLCNKKTAITRLATAKRQVRTPAHGLHFFLSFLNSIQKFWVRGKKKKKKGVTCPSLTRILGIQWLGYERITWES